jgi:histidine triad (HIT) family protein
MGEQIDKQIQYRDARTTGTYDKIWQSTGKCVFCDLRDKYIILEENGMALTVSLFAYIDGHIMIIPRRHVRSAKELSATEWDTVRKFSYIAKRLIKKVHGIGATQMILRDGGITAQSTVSEHLHIHVIPFDAPDLSQWNYRQLKQTPLENVAAYKQARKLIAETDVKFEQKYAQPTALPMVCDVLLPTHDGQLVFEERSADNTLEHNFLTPPGGSVQRYDHGFEYEIAREVQEELGLILKPEHFQLLLSRPAQLTYHRRLDHLKMTYDVPVHMLLNTYIHPPLPEDTVLTPGDDCGNVVYLTPGEAAKHHRLSPAIRHAVTVALERGLLES